MSRAPLVLAAAVLGLTFGGLTVVRFGGSATPARFGPPVSYAQQGLPLDPLTDAEIQLAERTAAASSEVSRLLGGNPYRVIDISLLPTKPTEEESSVEVLGGVPRIGRNADVRLFVERGNYGIRAIVNLDQPTLVQVVRLDGQQVPLTRDDIAAALQLARSDARFQATLGAAGLAAVDATGLRIRSDDPADPCSRNRCVQLLPRQGAQYFSDAVIIVDLTDRIVRFEEVAP